MIEGLFHPMPDNSNSLAVALFSEILTADQLVRNRLSKVLPKGMEISHFSVLNHLARSGSERTPAQLAKSFHVTRGAMTNTLGKLEWAGYIHIRRRARDAALDAISPMIAELISELGDEKVRAAIPILRELRFKLEED